MKVRIGIAFGQWPLIKIAPEAIVDLIDDCEALDLDSIWLSDRLDSQRPLLEPIAFLSYIAGRLRQMKLGTSTLVLPTRHPVVLAKELATLDFLARGRLFPAFGLGGDDSTDLQAVGVNRKERAARADEMIVLMRRLWAEENVSFEGKFYSVKDVTITPHPWQKNGLPIWIGGRSHAPHRTIGRRLARIVCVTRRSRNRNPSDSPLCRGCRPADSGRSLWRADSIFFRSYVGKSARIGRRIDSAAARHAAR